MEKFKPLCWHLPRPNKYSYKGAFPLWFEEKFVKLIGTKNFTHCFSGKAKFGYPKIDLLIENKPDICADVHHLPLRDNSVDNILLDPPYNNEYAKNLYNTPKLRIYQYLSEVERVTKEGGLIAVYHLHVVPRPKNSTYLGLVAVVIGMWHKARILTLFKKGNHISSKPKKETFQQTSLTVFQKEDLQN